MPIYGAKNAVPVRAISGLTVATAGTRKVQEVPAGGGWIFMLIGPSGNGRERGSGLQIQQTLDLDSGFVSQLLFSQDTNDLMACGTPGVKPERQQAQLQQEQASKLAYP